MTKFALTKLVLATGTLVLLASVWGLAANQGQAADENGFQLSVSENGQIHLPDVDFRKDWTALGTWAIAAEEGTLGSEGFHTVYTQPGSVVAFRKDGRFPDGAVLIKELYSTTTQDMTTGTVSRVKETTGWFVMIKDSKGRFPDNPLWGDGWGWAYFDAEDPSTSPSSDYKTDCLDCHIPAEGSDWIYTQGYPVLQVN